MKSQFERLSSNPGCLPALANKLRHSVRKEQSITPENFAHRYALTSVKHDAVFSFLRPINSRAQRWLSGRPLEWWNKVMTKAVAKTPNPKNSGDVYRR